MPLTPIIKPQFPSVPDVAGVPALKRSGLPVIARAVLSGIEGYLWTMLTADNRWGVFTKDGVAIAVADSVLDMGYRAQNKVSNYPVQAGGFASYNKVASPFEATVRLSKGGGLSVVDALLEGGLSGIKDVRGRSERLRGEFLDAIDAASKSLDLYHVVTPEKTYTSCNIQEYSYRREQSAGAHRIEVELSIVEIRETKAAYSTIDASAQINNPKQPEASPPVSSGKVQTQQANESLLLRAAKLAQRYLF